MYVLQDESGYRWPRDDHPMSRQPEYRYFIRLYGSAIHRLQLFRAFFFGIKTGIWEWTYVEVKDDSGKVDSSCMV